MRLYEINERIRNCVKIDEQSAVDTLTGEVIDIQALKDLQMERSEKIKNIALWYKDLEAETKALEAEEKAFHIRRKTAENKAQTLKNLLSDTILQGQKIKDVQYAITWRKSKAVEITDDKAVPDIYRIPQPDKIDKAGIRRALKSGVEIPGAELVEKENIQIK